MAGIVCMFILKVFVLWI